MKDLLFIVNPVAGRGRVARSWPAVRARIKAAGIAFHEAVTSRAGEAVTIAVSEAGNHACIVAVGGDGTVHEVANGLVRSGGKAALGVVPLGSGDDFAKLLDPGDPVERLARKRVKAIDIGRIASGAQIRYFANGMDIGFGAHGARNVQRVPRFLTGFGAYLGALALTMLRYPRLRVRMQLDDGAPFDLVTAMTAVMNGTTFGGSFQVCPEARSDDGLLDLLLVDAVSRLEILQLVPKILRGAHAGDPRLRLVRAKRLTLESDDPLLLEADGEIAFQEARQVAVEVLPRALRVYA